VQERSPIARRRAAGTSGGMTNEKGARMSSTPETCNPPNRACLVVIYDLRVCGTVERLQLNREACREDATLEWLYTNHVALIIKPGGARRLAQ